MTFEPSDPPVLSRKNKLYYSSRHGYGVSGIFIVLGAILRVNTVFKGSLQNGETVTLNHYGLHVICDANSGWSWAYMCIGTGDAVKLAGPTNLNISGSVITWSGTFTGSIVVLGSSKYD